MDAAKLIYDGLSKEEQEELKKEYEAYVGNTSGSVAAAHDPHERIVQTAGRDNLGSFAPEFARFNDDILFGENWNNADIDLKTRSIVTVVVLIAQGITDSSLRFHILNAKNHGVTQKEMAAVITHAAFYAGWPKAWAAFNIAQEVYSS
ncbi:MAG: carboxymuconolactone decarboxylase family protein [Lachnospiraceae bacterium]|nr:carboxymuconolactone decarboxylase family protein [Lachnospiraceae bacterium]